MEMVRTKTLVKNAIVQIDATPFRQWFLKNYGVEIGKKGVAETPEAEVDEETAAEQKKRYASFKSIGIDPLLEEQFSAGRLLACISTRPGQTGKADGYILEGEELSFYKKKLEKKKSK